MTERKPGKELSVEAVEQLVKYITDMKNEAMKGFVKIKDEKLQTAYSHEYMICSMILSKIETLKTHNNE